MTQNKPTILYKLRLFLLALLGYCCIFLMPAIFLAVLGVLFWSIITGKGLYGPLIFFEIVLLILAGKFVQELRAKVRWLFNQFFRRYWNYFRHYSLAFARTREYEADRLAAELTTAEVTADALIRFEYGMEIFDQYWPDFEEMLSTEVSPNKQNTAAGTKESASALRPRSGPSKQKSWKDDSQRQQFVDLPARV
jgi:Zn-dependent protease with chaperone function